MLAGRLRWRRWNCTPVMEKLIMVAFFVFLLFDINFFESGTTGSWTNQAASFPTPSCAAAVELNGLEQLGAVIHT